VLKQKYVVDEIIVVDDGSRDKTVEIAVQYPARVVRHKGNKGLGAARNTGLRIANNELVASLDADCVADSDWLRRLVVYFDDDRVGIVGGRLIEAICASVADRWRKTHMSQEWGDRQVVNPKFMFGNNTIIRKSVVEGMGGYDERLRTNGEDADLSRRLRAKGYNMIYDPGAIVRHLRHDNIRSILDAHWKYWRYGSRAYFQDITMRAIIRNLYYSHFKSHFFRFFKSDWRRGNYEFQLLDLLLLIYMAYRDLELFLRDTQGRKRP
jgi:glycosyltransferase involved in cell wall biosynthesis